MAMQSVQATKVKYVEEILRNPTYPKDSGAYRQLRKSLLKLSKDDLAVLALFVGLRK